MKTAKIKCPKCKNFMEEGFVMERTVGAVLPSQWVKGKPEKSIWTMTKIRGKESRNLQAFRCTMCGYIELYAV